MGTELKTIQLHPLDHRGTAVGTVERDGHILTVDWEWFNSGTVRHDAACSCGVELCVFTGESITDALAAWDASHVAMYRAYEAAADELPYAGYP